MKIILPILLALLAPAGAAKKPAAASLWFENVQTEYRAFAEIEPRLVNAGGRPVYLKWTYPHGAILERFDEATGRWEAGASGINCATGLGRPIEVGAGETAGVRVQWERSVDDSESPKFFLLGDHETLRPLAGRYRLTLLYAEEVWALGRRPEKIYCLRSQEFWIVRQD